MKTEARIARDEKYRRVGQAITNLEREWRIARGESPNPWRGKDSNEYNSSGPSARTRVMQIISRRPMSKLEIRSLELLAVEHE